MKELKVIGILVVLIGVSVALIGFLASQGANNITEQLIAAFVAFIGGLVAGIGGNIVAIAVKK